MLNVNLSEKWISDFQRAVEGSDLKWVSPHAVSKDNETSFEWWKEDRNLTVFIRGNTIEILKVRGPVRHIIMENCTVLNAEDSVTVWKWLHGNEN